MEGREEGQPSSREEEPDGNETEDDADLADQGDQEMVASGPFRYLCFFFRFVSC